MSIHIQVVPGTAKGLAIIATVISLALSAASLAHGDEKHPGKGRVVVPAHDTPKGKKCVEPPEIMRKSHMEFILHQRDKTLRQGVRTKKYSLKNCVACHADPKTKSVLKKADGKPGFCAACHAYTAVKIDCFSCHTDKAKPAKLGLGGVGAKVAHRAQARKPEGAK